jgi:hypothetical protein
MAARQNRSPAETLNLLLEHYGRLIPIPLTSLVYSQMTLKEEVAKQTIPQAYSDYCNAVVEQTVVKPVRDAYERMMREESTSADKKQGNAHSQSG